MARALLRLRRPGPGSPPSRRTKRLLVKAGESASDRAIYGLLGVFNYVHVGWWLKRRGFRARSVVEGRERIFDQVAATVGGRRVLYLEFGVADGYSMRYWSQLLVNPNDVLHGFDSFEGLPSEWAVGWPAGKFTQSGELPQFDDERVRLF